MGDGTLDDVTAEFLSDPSLGGQNPASPQQTPVDEGEFALDPALLDAPAEPAQTPAPTPPQSQTPEPPARPAQRDLSWAPPESHRALRAMSNEAYDLLSPIYRSHLEGANQKAPSYYEHPEGYQLDPQYREYHEQVEQLGKEYTFWRRQKEAALKGEPVRSLEIDPKTGRIMVTEAEDPTAEHIVEIDTKLAEARQYQQAAAQELERFKSSFEEQHRNFHDNLVKVYEKEFKPLEASVGPALQKFLDARFPKALHSQPQFRTIAVLALSLQKALKRISALDARGNLQASVGGPAAPVANGSNLPASPRRITKEDESFFDKYT